jgi:hypothetical protein
MWCPAMRYTVTFEVSNVTVSRIREQSPMGGEPGAIQVFPASAQPPFERLEPRRLASPRLLEHLCNPIHRDRAVSHFANK